MDTNSKQPDPLHANTTTIAHPFQASNSDKSQTGSLTTQKHVDAALQETFNSSQKPESSGANQSSSDKTPTATNATGNGADSSKKSSNATTVVNDDKKTDNLIADAKPANDTPPAQGSHKTTPEPKTPDPNAANDAADQTPSAGNNLMKIGDLINDANRRLIGGVFDGNQTQIVQDLNQASTQLGQAIKQDPNLFMGVTQIHAQTIQGQLEQVVQGVQGNVNATIPKLINDIQGDISDIAAGDKNLVVLGITPLPALNTPAAPFQNNAEQTQFLNQFNTDAGNIASQAQKIVAQKMPNSDAATQLIEQAQTFANQADQFSTGQGGIYSARFNNELVNNGTNGTAIAGIINGIKTNNPTEVNAAAQVLTANAADLGANMTPVEGGKFAFAAANPNA